MATATQVSHSREEKLLHILSTKSCATTGTLSRSAVQLSLYARSAEHVHALGYDDILLPFMADIAAQQCSQAFELLLCLLRHAAFALSLLQLLHFGLQSLHNSIECYANASECISNLSM